MEQNVESELMYQAAESYLLRTYIVPQMNIRAGDGADDLFPDEGEMLHRMPDFSKSGRVIDDWMKAVVREI